MTDLRAELADQVANLDAHFAELKAAAQRRLGQLFNPADYPESLQGLFGMEWEFPAIEPPSYLQQLSPELYEQERQRVAARFDEAVRLAEQAFAEEFSRLVAHLTERLSGAEDGKPKVFRDSVVNNLSEFFERFRSLNIRSNEDLDNLVAQAQSVVRGVAPQALRDDGSLRNRVAGQLSSVQASLDGWMVDRPRRRILREAATGRRRDAPRRHSARGGAVHLQRRDRSALPRNADDPAGQPCRAVRRWPLARGSFAGGRSGSRPVRSSHRSPLRRSLLARTTLALLARSAASADRAFFFPSIRKDVP